MEITPLRVKILPSWGEWGTSLMEVVLQFSGGGYNSASMAILLPSLGGDYNTALGSYSSVSGGHSNEADGGSSSVSGGQYNTASGDDSSISGDDSYQNWVITQGYLTSETDPIASAMGYATEPWVLSQGYSTGGGGIVGLDNYLTVDAVNNTVLISGANLQVVSGGGSTDATVNGTGNIIIGYDEDNGDDKSGSHNLVVGKRHSYTAFGGIVVGYDHILSGSYGGVLGGAGNIASGFGSTISGGQYNSATNTYCSVLGGYTNEAIWNCSYSFWRAI